MGIFSEEHWSVTANRLVIIVVGLCVGLAVGPVEGKGDGDELGYSEGIRLGAEDGS